MMNVVYSKEQVKDNTVVTSDYTTKWETKKLQKVFVPLELH